MEAQSQLNQTLCYQSISFNIWPPTQRTRDAIIQRLIETLSAPSVLSKRYGTLSSSDASDVARRIEDEALSIATAASATLDDGGIEVIHLYSKEISKLIIDTVRPELPSIMTPASGMPPPSHAADVSSNESES